MKVYVVEQGYYSDRSLVAVYAEKAHADRHAEIVADCDVTEVEVTTVEPTLYVTRYMGITIDWECFEATLYDYTRTDIEPTELDVNEINTEPSFPGQPFKRKVDIHGKGTDVERLERAMQDRVGAAKARLSGVA